MRSLRKIIGFYSLSHSLPLIRSLITTMRSERQLWCKLTGNFVLTTGPTNHVLSLGIYLNLRRANLVESSGGTQSTYSNSKTIIVFLVTRPDRHGCGSHNKDAVIGYYHYLGGQLADKTRPIGWGARGNGSATQIREKTFDILPTSSSSSSF